MSTSDPSSAQPPVTVVLCDDVPAFRTLMRAVLDEHPGIVVVGEAEDGAQVIPVVARERPDVVLLDLAMPHCDGLMATPSIIAASPGTKVIGLSGFAADTIGEQMLDAGASAYLEKGAELDVIARTVLGIARGVAR